MNCARKSTSATAIFPGEASRHTEGKVTGQAMGTGASRSWTAASYVTADCAEAGLDNAVLPKRNEERKNGIRGFILPVASVGRALQGPSGLNPPGSESEGAERRHSEALAVITIDTRLQGAR